MDTCIRFTKQTIDALPVPPADKRVTYREDKTPGLELRVSSTGTKAWSVFRRTKGGPPIRVSLGRYPEMTIEQARKKAATFSQEIQAGGDPAAIRRANREEMTFRELFEQYIERHAKPRKRTWKEDETKYKQYLARPLGGKKLSAIGRRDIAQVHSSVSASGHPTTANRVLAMVSSVFGWAISAGLWDKLNPAKGIKRNRERSRDRFLQADELPHFFAALTTEPLDTVRDYVWVSLLTGARRANVLAMRWRDISFDRAEWRIERTKNGEPQTVTLTPEAIEILRRRKPAEVAEYVFPGPGKAGHLTEPRKTWRRILARAHALGFVQALANAAGWESDAIEQARSDAIADPRATLAHYAAQAKAVGVDAAAFELRDLRIHDLRRTLGSWQARGGASLAIIGKSLNHKSVQTTAIYARLDQDPVRQSVERATSEMFAAAGIAPAAEVIPLPRKAALG
jgi:integrase